MYFSFSLQILSETFLMLSRTERDIVINVCMSSCKVPVILVRFRWKFNSVNIFSKNNQILNFMKNLPVGAELFHEDGQKDRHDEANSRFSQILRTRLKMGPTLYTVHRRTNKIIGPPRSRNRVSFKTYQWFVSPRQSVPKKETQMSLLCTYKHDTGPLRNHLNIDHRFTITSDPSSSHQPICA